MHSTYLSRSFSPVETLFPLPAATNRQFQDSAMLASLLHLPCSHTARDVSREWGKNTHQQAATGGDTNAR